MSAKRPLVQVRKAHEHHSWWQCPSVPENGGGRKRYVGAHLVPASQWEWQRQNLWLAECMHGIESRVLGLRVQCHAQWIRSDQVQLWEIQKDVWNHPLKRSNRLGSPQRASCQARSALFQSARETDIILLCILSRGITCRSMRMVTSESEYHLVMQGISIYPGLKWDRTVPWVIPTIWKHTMKAYMFRYRSHKTHEIGFARADESIKNSVQIGHPRVLRSLYQNHMSKNARFKSGWHWPDNVELRRKRIFNLLMPCGSNAM